MTVPICRRVALVLAMLLSGLTTLAADAGRPPNIVWLTVEDMSPWIGPYGDRTVPTPHLDRLAREGVVHEHAFATSPVCAPARTPAPRGTTSAPLTAVPAPRQVPGTDCRAAA